MAGSASRPASNADKRTLHLEFVPDPRVKAATELYIPAKRFFKDGYKLTVNRPASDWQAQWDAKLELMALTLLTAETTPVVVDVAPK